MSRTRILILIGLFILIVVGLVVLVVVPGKEPAQNLSIGSSEPREGSAPASATSSQAQALSNLILVSAPTENSAISSPLAIAGQARGTWYFEASAPVQLLDANGTVIAQGHLTAQGDWMTAEFVPFTATLTFTKPATPTGTLVLKNDNPSGDPSRQKELDIPVKF